MELNTIAKPYANALFDIAQQNKSFADWQAVLNAGTQLANDESLQAFIESPSASKADKTKAVGALLVSIVGRTLSTEESIFVGVLLENGRINALPTILELFEGMMNLNSDAKVFQVLSAYPLSAAEEKQIVSDLSDKYNTTVSIETEVDENLVGGLIIKEGDKVIDLSIQARVDALSLRLSTTH